MSLRRLIVEVDLEGLNVRRFCAEHGASTWFFYDLRRRHAVEGPAALVPKSRAPRRVANRVPAVVEEAIVALRKELVDAGLDAGAETIRYHLQARGLPAPSVSTIWRMLDRRGFIIKDPTKVPRRTRRSFSAERANECWQSDDTGWALADGTAVKINNVIDDCCRLAVASRAALTCTAATVLEAVLSGAAAWGLPERILTDNGSPQRAAARELAALGVSAGHSRPYHPQTCGKVERFHQTLKRYLDAQPAAATIEDLQAQLAAFVELYNHHRPHRALGRRTPAGVWASTARSGPADRPLAQTTTVHHATVIAGRVPLNRYFIGINSRFDGELATVVVTGDRAHTFVNGRFVRALTIDPTRRYQPQHLA